jgi:hypothetical protein
MASVATQGALAGMRAGGLQHVHVAPGMDRCLLLVGPSAMLPLVPSGGLALTGTLQHARGGLADETVDVLRAVAVPGPQCTLMDVASTLLAVLKVMNPLVDITALQLVCAIVRYNEELLMPGRAPGPDNPITGGVFPAWRVGLQLTLPVEFDAAGSSGTCNLADLKRWAGEYASWGILGSSKWAEALATPTDAFALRAAVAAAVPASGSLSALAASLRRRLLTNACEVVFELIETFRAIGSTRPGDLNGFALDLASSLKAHHIGLLAAVSGGHAVLRRLWSLLSPIDPATLAVADRARLVAVLQRIAEQGLGLQPRPTPAVGWLSPQEVGPKVQPLEPPLAASLRWNEKILKWEKDTKGKSVAKVDRWLDGMVLGRLVRVSNPVAKGDVWGYTHSNPGTAAFNPVTYLAQQAARVPGLADALTLSAAAELEAGPIDAAKLDQRMKLAARIAESEGKLDAISAGDPGIISMGMQQWAAHNDNELTVLLERFRVQAPDLYDLFIGMWGLQTGRWAPSLKGTEAADAARLAKIDAANPFGPDPATLSTDAARIGYFPQCVSLFVLEPQKAPAVLPPPPYRQPGPRRAYFLDGTRGDAWCARFRLAEILSIELCRAQLHQAGWRLTRLETQEFAYGSTQSSGRKRYGSHRYSFKPCVSAADAARLAPPATVSHTYAELFPSWLGAAGVLDHHINKPSSLLAMIKAAIAKTLGPSHVLESVVVTPGHTEDRYVLDRLWLERLVIKFLGVRDIPNANLARTVHLLKVADLRSDAQCGDRDAQLSLSSEPGSFTGW